MTSATVLVVNLLKASVPVAGLVQERIEPEVASGRDLPRVVVRQGTSRQVYGLERSSGLREARVTVLSAARTFTSADRLAETVINALKDVRGAEVLNHRVTIFQDGEDASTWDQSGEVFQRVTGFRVSLTDLR